MQLMFRPEARQALLAAQAWYEERSTGLGFEFARAVDAAIGRALRMPLSFPLIEADFPPRHHAEVPVLVDLSGIGVGVGRDLLLPSSTSPGLESVATWGQFDASHPPAKPHRY